MAPKGSDFCPNCGASLTTAPGAEGSDAAVYPKLAQANLLRMRKQYKEAEDMCLNILHQYPHNLSANTLMGDISVEEGHLDQAVEWYELALDIDPDSEVVKDKLESVEDKRQTEVVATTAERLGLPTEKPKTALIATISILAIIVIGVLAFLAYRASTSTSSNNSGFESPIIVGQNDDQNNKPIPPNPEPTPTPIGTLDDQDLTKALTSKEDNGAFISSAQYLSQDVITITYMVQEKKKAREIGADLAVHAFGIVKDQLDKSIKEVVLRATKDKKYVYSATVSKSDYDATQLPEWQNAHKGDDAALMKAVLQNENTFDQPATTGTTGGTVGTGGGTGSSEGTTGSASTTGSTSGAAGSAAEGTTGTSSSKDGTTSGASTGTEGGQTPSAVEGATKAGTSAPTPVKGIESGSQELGP